MTEEDYPYSEWVADISGILIKPVLSPLDGAKPIRDYCKEKYTDPVQCRERGIRLTLAIKFLRQKHTELEENGAIVAGENTALLHPQLLASLHRWLVRMPWKIEIPDPPMETVLRMIRGEE